MAGGELVLDARLFANPIECVSVRKLRLSCVSGAGNNSRGGDRRGRLYRERFSARTPKSLRKKKQT
jgi:hypothetical protein